MSRYMRTAAIAAVLSGMMALVHTPSFAQTQVAAATAVNTPADVAGSWHGYGQQTRTETVIVIGNDGHWTTASTKGKESGQGSVEAGVFVIKWADGYGTMKVGRTDADSVSAAIRWYYQGRWVTGRVDATRCQKSDCTDKTKDGANLLK